MTGAERFHAAQLAKLEQAAQRVAALEAEKAELRANLRRMHMALLNAAKREMRAKDALALERQRTRVLQTSLRAARRNPLGLYQEGAA